MLVPARTCRYSGSERPACRMNHTGGRGPGRPKAARTSESSAAACGAFVITPHRAMPSLSASGSASLRGRSPWAVRASWSNDGPTTGARDGRDGADGRRRLPGLPGVRWPVLRPGLPECRMVTVPIAPMSPAPAAGRRCSATQSCPGHPSARPASGLIPSVHDTGTPVSPAADRDHAAPAAMSRDSPGSCKAVESLRGARRCARRSGSNLSVRPSDSSWTYALSPRTSQP